MIVWQTMGVSGFEQLETVMDDWKRCLLED